MEGVSFVLQNKEDSSELYKIDFIFHGMNGWLPPHELEDFCYKVNATVIYTRI